MPDPFVRPYLDSCAYLDWFTGAARNRDVLDELFASFEHGKLTLVASTFVVAEVTGRGDEVAQASIDGYFKRSGFLWVEVGRAEAQLSRDLVRRYGVQGKDAVRLAAAQLGDADVFFTTDRELLKLDSHEGIPIAEPYWHGQRTMRTA